MKKKKVAIVYSNYYPEVISGLLNEFYSNAKVEDWDFTEFSVFGSFELPFMVKSVLQKEFDAVAVFGCIIKGKTFHHELINLSVIPSLLSLSLEFNKPIGVSVLTVRNYKQALSRSSGAENRGSEAYCALKSFLA